MRAKNHFDRLVRQLKRRCSEYDAGNVESMYDASTYLATMLISGRGRTKSLVLQLGLESDFGFPDTAATGRGFTGSGLPTLLLKIEKDAPICSAHVDDIDFSMTCSLDEWLDRPICGFPEAYMSRRKLIKTMRDQDGGAHVDASISDAQYRDLVEAGMPNVKYQLNSHGDWCLCFDKPNGNLKRVHFVESLERARSGDEPIGVGPLLRIYGVELALMRSVVQEVLFAIDAGR